MTTIQTTQASTSQPTHGTHGHSRSGGQGPSFEQLFQAIQAGSQYASNANDSIKVTASSSAIGGFSPTPASDTASSASANSTTNKDQASWEILDDLSQLSAAIRVGDSKGAQKALDELTNDLKGVRQNYSSDTDLMNQMAEMLGRFAGESRHSGHGHHHAHGIPMFATPVMMYSGDAWHYGIPLVPLAQVHEETNINITINIGKDSTSVQADSSQHSASGNTTTSQTSTSTQPVTASEGKADTGKHTQA